MTTTICWQPSGIYYQQWVPVEIEHRASWLPLGPHYQAFGSYAFDDHVQESMDFGGRFARSWEKTLRVDLHTAAYVQPREASVFWRVDIVGTKDGQWKTAKASTTIHGGRISVERFIFDVSSFHADDDFAIVVHRIPFEAGDSLVGDALLLQVVATGGDDEDIAPKNKEISDEEFARRAGIYRGPK